METVERVNQEALVPFSGNEDIDRWLDLALEETFPASDPVTSHFFD